MACPARTEGQYPTFSFVSFLTLCLFRLTERKLSHVQKQYVNPFYCVRTVIFSSMPRRTYHLPKCSKRTMFTHLFNSHFLSSSAEQVNMPGAMGLQNEERPSNSSPRALKKRKMRNSTEKGYTQDHISNNRTYRGQGFAYF